MGSVYLTADVFSAGKAVHLNGHPRPASGKSGLPPGYYMMFKSVRNKCNGSPSILSLRDMHF